MEWGGDSPHVALGKDRGRLAGFVDKVFGFIFSPGGIDAYVTVVV